MDIDTHIVHIRTSQTAAFKQSMQIIDQVILEANIRFLSKKKNVSGIRFSRLTADKGILIKLNLNAENFDYFKCSAEEIKVGVNMEELCSMLDLIDDDYPMTLYMEDLTTLHIYSKTDSKETDVKMQLMCIGDLDIPVPPTTFNKKIIISVDKFDEICNTFYTSGSHLIEIASINNNKLSFKGNNTADEIVEVCENTPDDKVTTVVRGTFSLSYLMHFTKCTMCCMTMEMYLKDDFPLALVIPVATLGKMYVLVAPVESDGYYCSEPPDTASATSR